MASTHFEPQPGVLLIAPPMMQDPNFRRTVILLCEHGPTGSFGLVLNRPLDIPLAEVVQGVTNRRLFLSVGGPVQPDTLHFVHRHGDLLTETVPLVDGIYWGGDFGTLKGLVDAGETTPSDIRFFIGYAGWSPGQLDEEIEQDSWILAPATAATVFPDEAGDLWRSVMRRLGGEYALLANYPDDPRMN